MLCFPCSIRVGVGYLGQLYVADIALKLAILRLKLLVLDLQRLVLCLLLLRPVRVSPALGLDLTVLLLGLDRVVVLLGVDCVVLLLGASETLLLRPASGTLLFLEATPGPGLERKGRFVLGSPMMRAKDAFRRDAPFVAVLKLLLILPTSAVGALRGFFGEPATDVSNAVAKGGFIQYLARLRCVAHRQWLLCALSPAWERCQLVWCSA